MITVKRRFYITFMLMAFILSVICGCTIQINTGGGTSSVSTADSSSADESSQISSIESVSSAQSIWESLPESEPQSTTESEDIPALESKLDKLRRTMDIEEKVRIAFLGVLSENWSFTQVMQRAAKWDGYDVLYEIPDEYMISGDRGQYNDNVYLIIPAKGYRLAVGKVNPENGNEITEFYYSGSDDSPIIFMESADISDITSLVRCTKGTDDVEFFTGFSGATGRLRCEGIANVNDVTKYGSFDINSIIIYNQDIYDYIYYTLPVTQFQTPASRREQLMKGHMYTVFTYGSKPDFYLAAWYDVGNNHMNTLYSEDGNSWTEVNTARG